MRELLNKYREVISYCIFGAGTTIVNIVVYYVCAHPLNISTVLSTCIAWVLSVLFAYITNKIWVFQSKTTGIKEIIKELLFFFACRFLTGLLDVGIMYMTVDRLHLDDMIMKVISNVVVIIINYLASKILIFKK